jgi:hypothetical protein
MHSFSSKIKAKTKSLFATDAWDTFDLILRNHPLNPMHLWLKMVLLVLMYCYLIEEDGFIKYIDSPESIFQQLADSPCSLFVLFKGAWGSPLPGPFKYPVNPYF